MNIDVHAHYIPKKLSGTLGASIRPPESEKDQIRGHNAAALCRLNT